MSRSPSIFLSAGEASGEHYGTLLIPALRRLMPDATFFGLGGQRMEALGFRPIVRAEDVAVMGITEVVRHMPHIYSEYRRLKASIATQQPSAAILIDFPDVNLGLARELRRRGVPVVYFVSPQLWAWKRYRIRKVQRSVDRMLVIFPFEEAFYREHGVTAEFVGHPLAELDTPGITREAFAAQCELDPSKDWIALLPGSRIREISLNLPEMLATAAQLGGKFEYILPLAPTLTHAQREIVHRMAVARPGPAIHLADDARATLHHARASLVASGTATVEAALIGNPFIVVYRVSRITYAVARRVVKVPHVAMVNLIAGRRLVPELIQDKFTAAKAAAALRPLLAEGSLRSEMIRGLREVSAALRPHPARQTAIDRVASITSQLIYDSQLSPVG